MTERPVRMRPLSQREQAEIRGIYRAGDAFRNEGALAERFNVSVEDVLDVVGCRYKKGIKKK